MMKVLTVWQPWATLIAIGAKPYEFRGGVPPRAYVGQRIAIHAGARKPVLDEVDQLIRVMRNQRGPWAHCLHADIALPLLERVQDNLALLPLRMILCTALLGAPRDGHDIAAEFGKPANDSDRYDKANFGWPLTEIKDVVPPVEHTGKQGWSEWSGIA
jgi:hypothetical protein